MERKCRGLGRAVASLVVGLGVVFALVTGGGSSASGAGSCYSVDPTLDPEEVGFYLLLSQYRADHGLPAVSISTNLTRAAAWFAQDLGERGYFSHTDSEGRPPSARANACGYPYPAGENIAAGGDRSSGTAAFNAWRESPAHDANMRDSRYVQVGIARAHVPGSPYEWYWVTKFGANFDGSDGSDLRISESGIRSAGLRPGEWNVATVLPGGLRINDLQGYTAWDLLPNGWWQQWAPGEFVAGGTVVGLLPHGMWLDRGRYPR